jgi:hypothetical protein
MRDATRRRRAAGISVSVGLALALLCAAAAPAAARTERVRWRYAAPERVDGFRVHVGTDVLVGVGLVIDVGKPTADGNVYEYALELGDDAVVYVAISAYAGSAVSELSNQVKYKPGGASRPPPDGEPEKTDALVERFGSYDVGDDPAGWLDTGPGATRGANDSLFAVARVKGNRTLTTESELGDIHSHYLTPESPSWTHYEFRGRMRIDDPDGGVGVTVLSQFPGRDAYYRIRRSATASDGEFAMAPHPEGYAMRCESVSTGTKPGKKRWYRFRVQVAADEGETVVRAKVWRGKAPEPKKWQVECVDDSPTRLVNGAPGVWSAGPGAKHWDDLRVIPLEPGVVGGGTRRAKPANPPGKPVLMDGN